MLELIEMIVVLNVNDVKILNVLDCGLWLRLLQFAYLVCKIENRLLLLNTFAFLLLLLDLVSELLKLAFLLINCRRMFFYLLIEIVLLVFYFQNQRFDFSLHVLLELKALPQLSLQSFHLLCFKEQLLFFWGWWRTWVWYSSLVVLGVRCLLTWFQLLVLSW